MQALILNPSGEDITKLVRLAGFPVTYATILGGGSIPVPHKNIKVSPSARSTMFVMQIATAQCVIINWDGKDEELLALALRKGIPTFVFYETEAFDVAAHFNWEDEDF